MPTNQVELLAVPGIPLVKTDDDLAALLEEAIRDASMTLQNGDVLVITSKIVSKSEGRWVDLATVTPDEKAHQIAAEVGKDPREVALILSESRAVSRQSARGVLITEHQLGFVCANAGIDHSNTRADGDWRLLLPADPDTSARKLRARLNAAFNVTNAVVLSDSHGRPFRLGTVGVSIGSAGLPALWDLRGRPDLFGVKLRVTDVGFADEIAAAAGLVMGQANEGLPAVIVRGLNYPVDEQASSANLIRPAEHDLYR